MNKYIIWARIEFPSSTCFPGDLCLERSTIGSIIVVITTSSVLFFMLLIKHVPLKAIIKPLTGGCSEGLVCLRVSFPFILDINFVGRTSRGHTGGKSHRISYPPSFCGACLHLSREKDSAIPFPRRP